MLEIVQYLGICSLIVGLLWMTHISSSTFCEGTPSYNDPISQGQIVNINCSPGIGSLYIPNKQWEKSKIVIEILKEGKSILKLPIKNETIDMTQFLR